MADDKQQPNEVDPNRASNMFNQPSSSIGDIKDTNISNYHNNNNLDLNSNTKYYSDSNNLANNTNAGYYSSSTEHRQNNTNDDRDTEKSLNTTSNLDETINLENMDNTVNREVKYHQKDANLEETAAEIAAPVSFDRGTAAEDEKATAGTGIGVAALILSIISLFVMPVLFGAVGIVLGFIARARGSTGLGSWAIGIGIVSIVMAMLIVPLF